MISRRQRTAGANKLTSGCGKRGHDAPPGTLLVQREGEHHVARGDGHLLFSAAQIADRVGTDTGADLVAPEQTARRGIESVEIALIATAKQEVSGG